MKAPGRDVRVRGGKGERSFSETGPLWAVTKLYLRLRRRRALDAAPAGVVLRSPRAWPRLTALRLPALAFLLCLAMPLRRESSSAGTWRALSLSALASTSRLPRSP